MNQKPPYFDDVKGKAEDVWGLLDSRKDLAGPWHQLFEQVQIPRQVLSELLQNADDAGATEARVGFSDGAFIFEHNGEDFTEEQFASLCRFGYSNKRTLHTIGFRGIGFKSTFSLGDSVELYTPSLAARFDKNRFTVPNWLGEASPLNGRTRVKVAVRDEHRKNEVLKNLRDWKSNPVSLLFFRNIRRLQIGDQDVHWVSAGPGPVPDSHWMSLESDTDSKYLHVRSGKEPFPEEALTEIREERMVTLEEETELPPCRVEIVLGANGRLFVVLPTGVKTELPFACNAPFIQDPARVKIKEPAASPTNRWLLDRVGRLAAQTMMAWLNQSSLSIAERADSYRLFPDVDFDDTSLEGTCGSTVERAFVESIEGKDFLLAHDGATVGARQAVIIPKALLSVWPPVKTSEYFDNRHRPLLATNIQGDHLSILKRRDFVEEIESDRILDVLHTTRLPVPGTWPALLQLWNFVQVKLTGHRNRERAHAIKIMPAERKDWLHGAEEVARIGDKRALQSDADWEFIGGRLTALDPGWTQFLNTERKKAEEEEDDTRLAEIEGAIEFLDTLGLGGNSDASQLLERVAADFFGDGDADLDDAIRLAQIAAKLNAKPGENFRFTTCDGQSHSPTDVVLYDDGSLASFFDEYWCEAHFLHPRHSDNFVACTREEWQQWISSGRAGVCSFVPLQHSERRINDRGAASAELEERGVQAEPNFIYNTHRHEIEDWDFPQNVWSYWHTIADEDSELWGRIMERVLRQPAQYFSRDMVARVVEISQAGTRHAITDERIAPSWILKFRDLPCLPDTRRTLHKPSDLLRRTPETEPYMDVELFIDAHLDNETNRPLLDLLGVRSEPTGPERVLECLRTLAKAPNPPGHEVEKWYLRLDQMMSTGSSENMHSIRDAFRKEKLILTADGQWATTAAVFQTANEEDVPGAALIRPGIADLMLWSRLGVPDRPTADLALQWLKELPSGKPLSQDDIRRVKAIMARFPERVWDECRHWLNLAGEWTPVENLEYALTMQTLVAWKHLHTWVKQKTADLQMLGVDITSAPPFSVLPTLASQIVERFDEEPSEHGSATTKEWLRALGSGLSRVAFDGDDELTERVRTLAERLRNVAWQPAESLAMIAYLGDEPAGTPRQADVVWTDGAIYVGNLPKGKLAKRVPEEIGKHFNRPDIKAALDYSFERQAADVRDYLEENFTLDPEPVIAGGGEAVVLGGNGSTRDPEQDASERPHDPVRATVGDGEEASPEEDHFPADDGSDEETGDQPRDVPLPAIDEGAEHEPVITADPPAPRQPRGPSLIERFAEMRGFRKGDDGRFRHADGDSIEKDKDGVFPWVRYADDGEVKRRYWPKEHCLDREPLEFPIEAWKLMERDPASYCLILVNLDGKPCELPGLSLRAMVDTGEIELCPASYRLIMRDGN